MVHIQAAEATIQLIPIHHDPVVVRLRASNVGEVDLAAAAGATLARLAMAFVDQQPMEPGVEAIGIAESVDVTPGGDERLLCRILGGRSRRGGSAGRSPIAGRLNARQLGERVVIAAHRSLHEIPFHRASGCARPIWSFYSL